MDHNTQITITRDNKLDYKLMARQASLRALRTFFDKFEYYSHYTENKRLESL